MSPIPKPGLSTDHQHGTDDTLILGPGSGPSDPQISLFGDAFAMYDRTSRGGNDTLIGSADANNALTGDARFMVDHARGGDDTLIGGAGAIN